MTFRSLTRRREIGANSYLLESKRGRFILDAGMHPKEKALDALPNYNLAAHDSVDAIFVSHAHHDHIGSLPVAQRRQPRAPVFMTEQTGEVGEAMLHNSVNVMTSQRESEGISAYPLFTHGDVDEMRMQWNYRDLRKPFSVPNTDVEAAFFDAGHILGSSGIQLRVDGKTFFYSGDVNFENQTIARAADFPIEPVDALVMETTRGDYQRPADYTRRGEKEKLAKVIRETFEKNGAVLIPVFALGKTQELLMMLHELLQMDLIPKVPVFIGGLSAKITLLYDRYASDSRRSYEGFRIFEDMKTLVAPRKRRKEIICQPHCIYALSSGMMSEGTVSNSFAQNFIGAENNTVAFVGYTDKDTPGAKLRVAKPGDLVTLDPQRGPVKLNCRVESFDFSAHSTRETICDYVLKVRPKKLLLVHGDASAMDWFAQTLSKDLPDTEIVLPEPGQTVALW